MWGSCISQAVYTSGTTQLQEPVPWCMAKMQTLCHVMSLFFRQSNCASVTVQIVPQSMSTSNKRQTLFKKQNICQLCAFWCSPVSQWHSVGAGNSCWIPWSMWASNTGKRCTISVLLSLRQSVQVALRSFKNLFHEARERAAKALGFAKKLTKVGIFFCHLRGK